MFRYIFIILAIIIGAFLPVQASINAKLGGFLKAPLMTALVSFTVGTVSLLFIVLGTKTPNNIIASFREAPLYVWIGGLIGATYVSSVIILVPRLGAGLSFSLIVAGQMIFSVIIDHFGMFGVPPQPLSWVRIVGVFLIMTGVFLIQRGH